MGSCNKCTIVSHIPLDPEEEAALRRNLATLPADYSSITPGLFPPGAHLPSEHLDQRRIMDAIMKNPSRDGIFDSDKVITGFLVAALSEHRAAGNIPDITFYAILEEVQTPGGRLAVSKRITE